MSEPNSGKNHRTFKSKDGSVHLEIVEKPPTAIAPGHSWPISAANVPLPLQGKAITPTDKAPTVPLQIRLGKDDAKAIKRSALDADQTLSEFMLACYHSHEKGRFRRGEAPRT